LATTTATPDGQTILRTTAGDLHHLPFFHRDGQSFIAPGFHPDGTSFSSIRSAPTTTTTTVPEETEHPNLHEYAAIVDGQVIPGTAEDSVQDNHRQQHEEDGQRRYSSEPTLGTTDAPQASKSGKSRFGKITKFFKKRVGGSGGGGKSINKGDVSANISSITASIHSGEVAIAPSGEMLAHESFDFETLLPHPSVSYPTLCSSDMVRAQNDGDGHAAAPKISSPSRQQKHAPPKKERKKLWKRGQPKEPHPSNRGDGLEPPDSLSHNSGNNVTDSVARMPGPVSLSGNGPNHSSGSVKADYMGYTEDGGIVSALALATAYDESDEYALKQENNIPLPLRLYAEVRMQK
jgi:hypothetical protein